MSRRGIVVAGRRRAPTLYVATTGSDTNAGTAAAPFATLQKAADVATPGSVVWVADGTYADFAYNTGGGNATDGPVQIRAQNKWGAKINFTGSTGNAIYVGMNYVDIVDFDITAPNTNIAVYTDGRNVRTIGCYVHDVQTSGTARAGAGINHEAFDGVGYNNPQCAVINCKVVNVGQAGNNLCHPIYLAGPNGFVHNNLVFKTTGWGIHCYHGPNGVQVMNNLVVDCGTNGGILIGDGPEVHTTSAYIGNNILVSCAKGISEAGSGIAGTVYRNNSFWNCTQNFDLWTSDTAGTVTGDPTFVNYLISGAGDYHLQSGSNCRNAGIATNAPDRDYDGNLRPLGAAVDIGPYEMA
jgi:hypothetical protein